VDRRGDEGIIEDPKTAYLPGRRTPDDVGTGVGLSDTVKMAVILQ